MMKFSKKTDYGLIALKHLALHHGQTACSASDIAEAYGISTPLMAKVLQKLARGGIVAAHHGSSGGYTLARDPARITALDAIHAIDRTVRRVAMANSPTAPLREWLCVFKRLRERR